MQACVFHRERSQQESWSHLGAMPIGAVLLFSVAESPREQDFRFPQLPSLRIQQCLELLSFLAHLSRVPARTQAANESQPAFRASLNYTHLGNGQNFCPLDLFSWSQQNIAQVELVCYQTMVFCGLLQVKCPHGKVTIGFLHSWWAPRTHTCVKQKWSCEAGTLTYQ